MRVTIAAIGKLKQSPERDLIESYRKRLHWKLEIKEFEPKKTSSISERKSLEASWLSQTLGSAEHIVALDERGDALTSAEFASHIRQWQNRSIAHIGFAIGGADGLNPTFVKASHMRLAFGTLTWPHMLVRAMLVEQLYRAQTILSGHPYHRE